MPKIQGQTALNEMFSMWYDDRYLPNDRNFKNEFSKDELIVLNDFDQFQDNISNRIPHDNNKGLHLNSGWNDWINPAKQTLESLTF